MTNKAYSDFLKIIPSTIQMLRFTFRNNSTAFMFRGNLMTRTMWWTRTKLL
jgi:hypothetical protein